MGSGEDDILFSSPEVSFKVAFWLIAKINSREFFRAYTLTGSAVILYLLADLLNALFITHCSETHLPKWKNEFCIISDGIKREWHSSRSFINSPSLSFWEILAWIFQLCYRQLTGFILQAAGRSTRECCDSAQHGLRRAAPWILLTENGNSQF